jgi:hypothetical protein
MRDADTRGTLVRGALFAGAGGVTIAIFLATAILTVVPREAKAKPEFAASTGKPCTFCHTTPPKLNATGKRFKANGFKL